MQGVCEKVVVVILNFGSRKIFKCKKKNIRFRVYNFQKPNSIPALKKLINEAAREISENALRRAVANFNCRVHLCIRNNGAHFEAEM